MLEGRSETKLVAFFGPTSTGKTTATHMLAGRLRTHGLQVLPVTDSARAMPFEPHYFDTHPLAYIHVFARKLVAETEAAMRPGVDVIISDRTVADWLVYWRMKHPPSAGRTAVADFARFWLSHYDALYFFSAEGTRLVDDGFREVDTSKRLEVNDAFSKLAHQWAGEGYPVKLASGTYRERLEFVYHDLVGMLTGKSRAGEIREAISAWLVREFGSKVKEVRVFGSNSATRMHVPSDHDDFDVMVVLKGDCPQDVREIYQRLQADRAILEPMCQATLDLMVCNEATLPYET